LRVSGYDSAPSNGERGVVVNEAQRLRQLASWYREFAERTGNPTIWDARLRTAEDLEAEAQRLERSPPAIANTGRG
jgi:hypothetical protein